MALMFSMNDTFRAYGRALACETEVANKLIRVVLAQHLVAI